MKSTQPKGLIIAVDGYAGAGKSSIAREIAHRLGLTHINSGYIYRALTLHLLNNNIDINNPKELEPALKNVEVEIVYKKKKNKVYLNNKNVTKQLTTTPVEENVSKVSKIKAVRDKVLKIQEKLSENGGIVMDGRDIGTTVFPNADLKLFVTADIDIRAKRKLKNYQGSDLTLAEVKQALINRDIEDETRKESPLKKATDAIEIDNSYLPLDEQVDKIIHIINQKTNKPTNPIQ
jgi:cytidylate kinase